MFKSVFGKYITAVTVIVLISFFLLASIVSSIIENDSVDRKMEAVEHMADIGADIAGHGYISGEAINLKEHLDGHPDAEYAINRVTHDDASVGLFILDLNGEILLVSDAFAEKAKQIISDKTLWAEVSSELVGNGVYKKTRVISSIGSEEQIVYAMNILDENQKSVGVSFAVSSNTSIARLVSTTAQAVVLACLWIMLAMLIAIYILTERIVDPLKRMSVVTKNYAQGRFDARIDVVGHDEVAELSTAFNNMANELDLLEKKRNQFLSDVSHELRSPMMAILGFVEGIRSGSVPKEKENHYLDITIDEVKRLSRLVADLLDVSRLEMGDKKLNFVKTDLCDKAFFVLVSLEKRIEDKHLEVSFESETDSLFVRADEDALHRIVYNLCENAIKFSYENAKLNIKIYENKNKDVVLEVYNEGIGISKEDLPHVFDRFYKSDKSRGEDKKGVGLGLYFVKTIVMAHDGDVFVESEEGKYCKFTLKFPRYHEK